MRPRGRLSGLARRLTCALARFSHCLSGKNGVLLSRESSSLAGFGGGEEPALSERSESKGADRRMRGRYTHTSFPRAGRSQGSRSRPPHPPSAPSPPAKNRGGRRALEEKAWRSEGETGVAIRSSMPPSPRGDCAASPAVCASFSNATRSDARHPARPALSSGVQTAMRRCAL